SEVDSPGSERFSRIRHQWQCWVWAEIFLQPVVSRDGDGFFGISPAALGPGRHAPSPPMVSSSPDWLHQGAGFLLRLLDPLDLNVESKPAFDLKNSSSLIQPFWTLDRFPAWLSRRNRLGSLNLIPSLDW